MSSPAGNRSSVRFGTFEVDLTAGELRQKGHLVRLQDQPFRVLAALLDSPGAVVTREQLRERLWPADTFVDFEHSVNAAIKKLRQALHDDPDSPRFIETLPRRGYRFIAPVENLTATAEHPSKPRFDQRWVGALIIAAAAIAVVAGFVVWRPTHARTTSSPGKVMLAVLPFENYSAQKEQDYLADGLTEETIAHLGSLDPERLGVIARTSAMRYKTTREGVDQIGKELGVDYILEGSVRTEADRVRVTAQLIRVRDQTHRWARTYERTSGGVLTMQDDVANAIADEIQLQLTPQYRQRVASLQFADARAHEAYARGRFFWNKRTDADLATSIQYFEEVLRYEPRYALAYSGLADAYFYRSYAWGSLQPREGMEKAKAAAAKALQLDPNSAEAHTSVALVKLFYDWDWRGAEAEFKRAIELNPNYATAHHGYAVLLMTVYGRFDDAISEANRALEIDPLSVPLNNIAALILTNAGRTHDAIERAQKLRELSPNMPQAFSYLSTAYERDGAPEKAVEMSLKAHEVGGASAEHMAQLRDAYAKGGIGAFRRLEMQMVLDHAKRQPPKTAADRLAVARANAELGNNSAALDILEQVCDERSGLAVWTKLDYSRFPGLRSDPRFQALLRRTGFPL